MPELRAEYRVHAFDWSSINSSCVMAPFRESVCKDLVKYRCEIASGFGVGQPQVMYEWRKCHSSTEPVATPSIDFNCDW
jgi:hypothetical protein